MHPLTQQQIDLIFDWMNSYDQLKNTSIPLRFKEDFETVHDTTTMNDVQKKCHHRGAWLTQTKNYYCPECKLLFKFLKCKICNGRGGLPVEIKD